MSNYINNLPRDKGGAAAQEFPAPVKAVAVSVSDNKVASSIIQINPNSTSLEIGASNGVGTVIRWVANTENASIAGYKGSVVASGLTANFDHFIPAGTVRRFAIPVEQMGKDGQAGSVHGLYQRVAVINAGISATSVIAVEY